MTAVQNKPAQISAGVAQLVNPLVAQLSALSLTTKQAHWHVRGATFIPVHEYLDEVVKHARKFADTLAERVVSLGAPTDGRVSAAAATEQARYPEGFQTVEDTLTRIIAALDGLIAAARAVEGPLADVDDMTQDDVISLIKVFEKDRWFLAAQLG